MTADQRRELGTFLRARRDALDPSVRGLPMAARRRATGLLREEVAALAGLSTTWYTYLEQGRQINPSPEVMGRIADVLELGDDERSYVWRLAFDTDLPSAPADEEIADPGVVVALIGSGPEPVYSADANGDLCGWNSAFATWYSGCGDASISRPNILTWMLTDPRAQESLVDWEFETRETIARVRSEPVDGLRAERRAELIAQLTVVKPRFRAWWDEHQIMGHRNRRRRMRNGELGLAVFDLIVLVPPIQRGFGYVLHRRVDWQG